MKSKIIPIEKNTFFHDIVKEKWKDGDSHKCALLR